MHNDANSSATVTTRGNLKLYSEQPRSGGARRLKPVAKTKVEYQVDILTDPKEIATALQNYHSLLSGGHQLIVRIYKRLKKSASEEASLDI